MVKLVILIEELDDWSAFNVAWPGFLHTAESMPGLLRETSSHVDSMLYGGIQVSRVHELFFDSLETARGAMASSEGRAAGALLQAMTGGKMVLFLADHSEDDLSNIRKYTAESGAPQVGLEQPAE